MKLLLKQAICGDIEGRVGQVIDCHDEAEAQRFIDAGIAVVHEDKDETIAELKARIAELEGETKGSKKGK